MRFKTLSEYDDEIKAYDRILDIFKKCVDRNAHYIYNKSCAADEAAR